MSIQLPGILGQITACFDPVRHAASATPQRDNPAASAAPRRSTPIVRLDPAVQHRAIERVLNNVRGERERQLDKWGVQHRLSGTGGGGSRRDADVMRLRCQVAEEIGGATWRDVLLEEVYEALAEVNACDLRQELVQVAAVCAAWIEDIDSDAQHEEVKES